MYRSAPGTANRPARRHKLPIGIIACAVLMTAGAAAPNSIADVSHPSIGAAVEGLAATREGASAFHLSWRYSGPPAAGFAVFRRVLPAGWEEIARLPPSARTFESTGLLAGQKVMHCVSVFGAAANGPCVAGRTVTTDMPSPAARGMIIAPRSLRFPRDGEGSIALVGGRLMFVYGRYEGSGDYAHASLAVRTSGDGGTSWSEERVLFSDARQLALPSLTALPGGVLILSYVEIADRDHARRVVRRSSDGGRSWGDPVAMTDGIRPYITGSHDRLRRLSDGRLIYPVHAQLAGGDLGTFVYVSDDGGLSWRRTTRRPLRVPGAAYPNSSGRGFWEAAIAETRPGHLLMVGRTAMGRLYRSVSTDFGESWSEPAAMPVLAPTAPPNIVQLPSIGATLLVWEPHVGLEPGGGARLVLGSLLSRDGGSTWSSYREIEYTGADWFSYPSLFVDDAGVVHLTYYGENDAAGDPEGHGNIFGGTRYVALPACWFDNDHNAACTLNSSQLAGGPPHI